VHAHAQSAVDTPQRSAQSAVSPELHRLIWSPVWDLAMRAVGFLWTGFLLYRNILGTLEFVQSPRAAAMPLAVLVSAVAARVAFLTFLVLLVFFFIVRLKPVAKATGIGTRAVALLGTFLPTLFGVVPRYEDSALINVASFACLAVGNGLSAYGFSFLSRSASIMAEARRLVTGGPYRFVRHPVYVFEEIAIVGVLLNHLWWPRAAAFALLIFFAHMWCQLQRMNNEEAVLEAAFPEYSSYKARTAKILPGLY
jgi:protein-S-isoprenylcysteine O-methyltransferase Ste14